MVDPDPNEAVVKEMQVKDLGAITKAAPTLTAQSTPTEWSSLVYKKYFDALPKFKRATLENAPAHALVFLSWYTGVKKIESEDILKTYHGILSAIEVDGKKLVPNSICVGPDDNAAAATNYQPQTTLLWKFINKNGTSAATYTGNQAGKFPITAEQCLEWIAWLYDLLRAPTEEDEALLKAAKDKQMLGLTYVGFLAMNTIRLITKDPYSVSEHIQQTTIDRLNNLLGQIVGEYPQHRAFCPPHYKFLIDMSTAIRKGSPLGVKMATFMTECFCASKEDRITSMWKAGCALSLSYTGLGAMSWFEKAISYVKKPPKEFLKEISIKAFHRFIGWYVGLAARSDHSWVFCRLMEDTALAQLSVLSMPVETSFFVALAGPQLELDDDIWAIASLRKLQRNDVAIGFALAISYSELRMKGDWEGSAYPEAQAFQLKMCQSGQKNYEDTVKRLTTSRRQHRVQEEALPRVLPDASASDAVYKEL